MTRHQAEHRKLPTAAGPRVSVLVPTYNRADYLPECLESLLHQTLPPFQIIVVNDGSTDHTDQVCAFYRDKIQYIERPQEGKPMAINFGLQKVTGEYVWFFDDDDVAVPDALERLVLPLERNEGLDFTYGNFYVSQTDERSGKIGHIVRESVIPDFTEKGFLLSLFEWNFLGGASVLARTTCYQEAGGFEPDLLRSQDYEMAIRLARFFKGGRAEGGPLFHYRQHQGVRGGRQDRFNFQERMFKWLEYDQMFFRKLFRSLSVFEFLPRKISSSSALRLAHLNRMAVMAYKSLLPQVKECLNQIAELLHDSEFSEAEYLTVRRMMMTSYYENAGTIFDRMEFFHQIRSLSRSRSIRILRRNVVRALLARLRAKPTGKSLRQVAHRIVRLHI